MKHWALPGWYQFEIDCVNFVDEVWTERYEWIQRKLKESLLEMSKIKDITGIECWFFLFEGRTIRVRIKTDDAQATLKNIQDIFPDVEKFYLYKEEKWKFKSLEAIEFFARMMEVTSEMVLSQLKEECEYDIYRQYERICHCLHVNMFGRQNELAILTKRLAERLGDLKGEKSKLSAYTALSKLK